MRFGICLALLLGTLPALAVAEVVDFEDLNPGSNAFTIDAGPGGFQSGGLVTLNNEYGVDPQYGPYWLNWAVSSRTAIPLPAPNFSADPTIQYASVTGTGAGGSATYAIGYPAFGLEDSAHPNSSLIDLAPDLSLESLSVTNTAWAYSIMKFGDPNNYARAFGSGDFFLLDIVGYDQTGGAGNVLGTVEIALADFRDGKSFILDTWQDVDLFSLASARSLRFGLRSTDISQFGGVSFINTPTYFALDNLTYTAVPEPASVALLALGVGLALVGRRRAAA